LAKWRPDLSENSFLGALVIVVGGVGSVIGITAIFIRDTAVLIGIAAGAGWTLSLCLFVMNARERRRIRQLEGEIGSQKRAASAEARALRADLEITRKQAGDWAASASNVSEASVAAIRLAPAAPDPPPRRAPAMAATANEPEQEQ
jgi:hypothetical protein